MSWGKGWEVGLNKAIYQQRMAQELAAVILDAECGTKHETGTRTDLCPKCQEARTAANKEQSVK